MNAREPTPMSEPARDSGSAGLQVRGPGGTSLERRFPLLMMVLLALILSLSVGVTYVVLSRDAEDTAYSRLAGASREVAAAAAAGADARLVALERFAATPAVRRLALGETPPDSAALAALAPIA